MSNLILSAFADEYADGTGDQLEGLNRFGIKYLEVRHLDGVNLAKLPLEAVREAKKAMDSAEIRVSALGSPLGKIPLDGDLDAHLETARHLFEAAKILETDYVRIFSFYAPEGASVAEKRSEVFAALEPLVLLARQYGLVLCHENEAKIYGDLPQRCREIAEYFAGEVKCVFDMGNFVLEGVDPWAAYETLKEHIAYFHIKDALAAGAIVPPGKGEAKIGQILSAHRKVAGKDFFVSLEPHLQTFSGRNALVGRSFENPYQYPDAKTAFADAVKKFKEII